LNTIIKSYTTESIYTIAVSILTHTTRNEVLFRYTLKPIFRILVKAIA